MHLWDMMQAYWAQKYLQVNQESFDEKILLNVLLTDWLMLAALQIAKLAFNIQ